MIPDWAFAPGSLAEEIAWRLLIARAARRLRRRGLIPRDPWTVRVARRRVS